MNYTAGIVKKDKKFTKTSKDKDFANDLVEVKIVIPEKNNVFEDKEEVLLVPSETKDDVKDYFYVLTSLEMYNYINNELNEELKSDINKKESIIIDNEKKINDLTNKIAINDSIIEDNEKEIHDLKSKIAIFKKEIKDNKIDISDLKDKIDIKDSLIITSNNEIDDLKGKLDIKDSIIESNKKKIEDLSSKIAIKTENSDKKNVKRS